jgi:hypothetical protein
VRQITQSNALERGQILLELLHSIDPMLAGVAIDEIGLSGDPAMGPALLEMFSSLQPQRSEFMRLRIIEALGRLREPSAEPVLRKVVDERKVWKWVYPREMRIAAAQALLKIDPEYAPQVVSASGLTSEELGMGALDHDAEQRWLRTRRYPRIKLARPITAIATSTWGRAQLTIRQLSLGGGLGNKDDKLRLGSDASLDLQLGLRHIKSQVILRRNRMGEISFEFVEMDLEERCKLRHVLMEELPRQLPAPV